MKLIYTETLLKSAARELCNLIQLSNDRLKRDVGDQCEEPEYLDYQTCSELEDLPIQIKKLIIAGYSCGYEAGHNDTVNSSYTDSIQSGKDWFDEAIDDGGLDYQTNIVD